MAKERAEEEEKQARIVRACALPFNLQYHTKTSYMYLCAPLSETAHLIKRGVLISGVSYFSLD